MDNKEIIEVLERIKEDTVLNSKRYEALEAAIKLFKRQETINSVINYFASED